MLTFDAYLGTLAASALIAVLARELHDAIGQQLSFIKMLIGKVEKGAPGTVPGILTELEGQAADELETVRDMSLKLRPAVLDDLGLPDAVGWLAERAGFQSGIEITYDPGNISNLPERVKISALRIIQESLTNVIRHSGASRS